MNWILIHDWENIGFMWIGGGKQPDFHTINNLRGETMKAAVRKVFASMMEFLVEEGYVKMENYFVDGTKVDANSNPHHMDRITCAISLAHVSRGRVSAKSP